MKRKFSVGFFIGLFAVLSFSKLASANSFTSSSAFQAAIAGYSIHTANFDSDASGNIAPGNTLDGLTFTSYSVNGTLGNLAVVTGLPTTSGTNSLGSDDASTGQ